MPIQAKLLPVIVGAWLAAALAGPAAAQPATPPAQAPAAPGAAPRAPLAPAPADTADVGEVTLPDKPAAVFAGSSSWDEAFETLRKAFATIEAELTKAGLAAAGRRLTVFVNTDDMGFRFEAMVPLASAPEGRTSLSPEVRIGRTPAGRALRFEHKGPYDVIDTTYETITAYLDAKGLTIEDAFIEEYTTDLADASDPNLEVTIYAILR